MSANFGIVSADVGMVWTDVGIVWVSVERMDRCWLSVVRCGPKLTYCRKMKCWVDFGIIWGGGRGVDSVADVWQCKQTFASVGRCW